MRKKEMMKTGKKETGILCSVKKAVPELCGAGYMMAGISTVLSFLGF